MTMDLNVWRDGLKKWDKVWASLKEGTIQECEIVEVDTQFLWIAKPKFIVAGYYALDNARSFPASCDSPERYTIEYDGVFPSHDIYQYT